MMSQEQLEKCAEEAQNIADAAVGQIMQILDNIDFPAGTGNDARAMSVTRIMIIRQVASQVLEGDPFIIMAFLDQIIANA